MDEKKRFRKKTAIIIALFVVFLSVSAKKEINLQVTEVSFWLAFIMGGLFISLIGNIVSYFKSKGE